MSKLLATMIDYDNKIAPMLYVVSGIHTYMNAYIHTRDNKIALMLYVVRDIHVYVHTYMHACDNKSSKIHVCIR